MNLDRETDIITLYDRATIQVIEFWGSDERIVEAARMSVDKGFLGWGDEENPGDEKLLKFLYSERHDSPFEMGGAVVEVQAPIMVFREWHRHRTQSYNEMSGRYTALPDFCYVPSIERMMVNANDSNRQANRIVGAPPLTIEHAKIWQERLHDVHAHAQRVYQMGLDFGVPKELARLPVTVSRYSRMRASACLRNWLLFITLRSAPNAQWEIRQFSNKLVELLALRFPRTLEFFRVYPR